MVVHRQLPARTGLRVSFSCASWVTCAGLSVVFLACGSDPPKVAAPTPPPTSTTPVAATTAAPHEGASPSASTTPAATTAAAPELPQPTLLIEGLKAPERLVADATNLYVTEEKTDSIYVAPKSGGEPKPFATGQKGLAEIALDATSVYWTTGDGKGGGTVMKQPLSPNKGAATKLATVPDSDLGGLIGLEVDDKFVYWTVSTSQGKVMRVGKTGGAAVVLADKQRSPYDVAGDATGIYWTLFGTGDAGGAVMSLPTAKPGAKVEPVVLAAGQKTPWCIAVDGKNAYWINKGPPGSIVTAPLAGGAPKTLVADLRPTFLAIDPGEGGNVYWTSEDDDTLSVVPKAGGARQILAKGLKSPTGIVVDASAIYFTNKSDGTVMKLPKVTGGS